ncbi:MAG TPA: isoprenylcysteine carboxylmethyltransferase family protein [Candidatus Saccharimonadaceae bacterium]|jgi:methyltransferase|nr:isoprenylcysteine carboxylmethyltransferase family protein [Candidatus Saccharimonadaceae bacterium]
MTSAVPAAPLAAFVVALAVERVAELGLSARHERALRAAGAVEYGAGHFPVFVALHVAFPLLLVAEVFALGARPPATWPLWLGVALAGAALRVASMRALGERWTARVWVPPGATPIRTGIYRWLSHPSYVAVTLELLGAPLMFGAWRTALVAGAWNALALALRIPCEERALGERG